RLRSEISIREPVLRILCGRFAAFSNLTDQYPRLTKPRLGLNSERLLRSWLNGHVKSWLPFNRYPKHDKPIFTQSRQGEKIHKVQSRGCQLNCTSLPHIKRYHHRQRCFRVCVS